MNTTQDNNTAVLRIGRWYSRCSACGNDAAPEEAVHTTRLGFDPGNGKGCGARYTAVQPDSYGIDDGVRAKRPDLPFLPPGPVPPKAD